MQYAIPRIILIAAVSFAALGCAKDRKRTSVSAGPPRGSLEIDGEVAYRTGLKHEDAVGISGSCWDGSARWLVGERNSRLLRVDRQNNIETFPIEGVPPGHELEGLACGAEFFYISTETDVIGRTEDRVLVLEFSEGVARVVDTLIFQYPAPMTARVNQGLEGLCIAGDWLIAAGEILRTNDAGVRQAPILRQKIGETDTFLHWVNLSSRTGKLSGLDCRERGGIIEVFAVERHYEVSRLLQFELGEAPSKSQTIVELGHITRETENFEAIIVDERGRVWLAQDNQYKTITGPSEETVLEPIPAFAH
ncbi:MAG: hypothetical protein GY811_17560 [Myxococcales bacterium]|nr:hypothetical protein [Myxococcales bacterium]